MAEVEYYPFITVDAPKFSERWNGQAMSDTIRCATDRHKAYRAGDTARLAKYIDHLQQNYMDYIRVYEPGDYVVDRVVNWLEIALNNYKDPADAVRAARADLVQVSKDPRLAIFSVEK